MSKNKEEKSLTLEESFSQIEEIIETMEQQEVSLEESFTLYQKGLEQLKNCHRLLDTVEKKMQIMNGEGELEEFVR